MVSCAQPCVAFTSSRTQLCVAKESSCAQPYTHGYNHVSGEAWESELSVREPVAPTKTTLSNPIQSHPPSLPPSPLLLPLLPTPLSPSLPPACPCIPTSGISNNFCPPHVVLLSAPTSPPPACPHNQPREWEGKEWCEADGHCGLRRERPREGKGKGRGKVRAGRKRKVKGWGEADGHHRLWRERVQGKGSKWRLASRRRQLQTRSSHHGVMPKPPPAHAWHFASESNQEKWHCNDCLPGILFAVLRIPKGTSCTRNWHWPLGPVTSNWYASSLYSLVLAVAPSFQIGACPILSIGKKDLHTPPKRRLVHTVSH